MSFEIISYCPICLDQTKHYPRETKNIHGHTITFMVCENCYSVATASVVSSKELDFNFVDPKNDDYYRI